MLTFEIRFYPKEFGESWVDDRFQWDMIEFMKALRNNGQVLDAYSNAVRLEDCYAFRVVAPERDSLDAAHYDERCKEFWSLIASQSLREPEIVLVGESYDVEDGCGCADPSHFVLLTTYIFFDSPVLCGDCNGSVPLYKLPWPENDHEGYGVLSWQRAYQACDTQFMEGIGERHGYRMMNNPNSALAQEGLRIASHLEQNTNKPFYYFLYKHYSKNKPDCPMCGDNWENHDDRCGYAYVCHDCRLISDDLAAFRS